MLLDLPTPFSVRQRYVFVVRILNFLCLVGIFIVNSLASILPINGRGTGEISNLYYTFITPAGYAFSIWGLIYFTLAIWGVYQLFPSTWNHPAFNHGIGYLFILNALANIGWIFAWHYLQMWLSVILMLVLLVSVLLINFAILILTTLTTTTKKVGPHV